MKCNKCCCGDKNNPWSDRPVTLATTEAEDKVAELIRDGRRIKSKLCAEVGTGKLAVVVIIRELGHRQSCTNWVTKMLAVEHKAARTNICAEPPEHSEKDEVLFCQKTDDETWVQHHDPLMKGQSRKCMISRRHARKIQDADICAKSRLVSSGRVKESCLWNCCRELPHIPFMEVY
jgi:hypothetical protein